MTTERFAPPVVATYGSRRPGGAARRAAARPRLGRARDPRPRRAPAGRAGVRRGAGADRRGRRLRLVRQPRHRPPGRRVAARDHGLVPRLARRGRARRAAGAPGRLQRRRRLRRRPGARRPAPLRRGRDPLRHPALRRRRRRSSPAAGPPAGVRRPGRRRPRHPARAARPHLALPARPSPARPTVAQPRARRAPAHRRDRRAQLGDWIAHRLAFLDRHRRRARPGRARRGPGRPCPAARCPSDAALGPTVSWTIPQQQRARHAPAELQERLFAWVAAAVRRRRRPLARSRCPGARGFTLAEPPARTTRSSCPRPASSRTCTRRTTARSTSPCRRRRPPTSSTKGWGGPHTWAGTRLSPGFVMVYGPRDDDELAIVRGIVAASHAYASTPS